MKYLFNFLRGGILVVLLLLMDARAHAQAPAWQMASSIGSDISRVTATATDANGNIYVVGSFYGQVNLGGTILTGSFKNFLAKWSTTTHSYLWAQDIGSSDITVTGIAVNGSSVYLTGFFTGTIQFGATTLTNSNPIPTGSPALPTADAFVAKLTDTGTAASFIWAQRAGGLGEDRPTSIAVSGASVYITGYFGRSRDSGVNNTPTSFGSINLTNAGYINIFVARMTDSGNVGAFTWAQSGGGTFQDYAMAIAVNGASIYLTGYYIDGTFSMGGLTVTNTAIDHAFIVKLTDTGSAVTTDWIQQESGQIGSNAYAIAVSGNNVYVTGNTGPGNFGNIPFTSNTSSIFVAKIVDAGNSAAFAWVQNAGSVSFGNKGQAVVVKGGNVYVGGSFIGPGVFGSNTLTTMSKDVFVAKLIDLGNSSSFSWVQQAGGPNDDEVRTLSLVGAEVYVSGTIHDNAFFGPYPVNNASGFADGYLAWLVDPTITAITSSLAAANITLFPNPAHGRATVQLPPIPGTTTATLTVLDALGRTLRTQTAVTNLKADLDLTGLAPGLYAVRVQAGGSTATQRLVVE